MTKLYVPLMASIVTDATKNTYLEYLQKIKTDTVMLVLSRDTLYMDQTDREAEFQGIAEHTRFFQKHGMQVIIWIDSYGFGTPIPEKYRALFEGEPRITSILGKTMDGALCPEGEQLVRLCSKRIQDIALLIRPDAIMMDDEFCLSVRPGLGCFCPKHMALYEKAFGEKHSLEELKELIFTGYHEKYRKGWLKVVGDSMRHFCRSMREALDEVDSTIRMGFCAGYTSWDVEGADALELSKILAGDTKPFLRFTGAAYWVQSARDRFGKQKMNEMLETVRMQEYWCRESGVEIFHEADTWPRPRCFTSASVCECYDVPLRVSGGIGSFKYLFNYDVEPEKELGYVKKHIRNMPLYDFIDKHCGDKQAVGIQVYEEMHKMKNQVLPDRFIGEVNIMTRFLPQAATFLTAHGIPTMYACNPDIAIAFSDNIEYVKSLSRKMILDLPAAEYLQRKGYQMGIKGKTVAKSRSGEIFANGSTWRQAHVVAPESFVCDLEETAVIESYFLDANGNKYPSSWRITDQGTEFLIFAIDAYTEPRNSTFFHAYDRKTQLLRFIGKEYPQVSEPCGIYQICKDNEKERVVFLQNFGEDEVVDCEIMLDKTYKGMQIFGAEGTLEEDRIRLHTVVQPFASVVIVLEKA